MKIHIKNLDLTIDGNLGDNLLRVLQSNHIVIPSSCNGNNICRKCKVVDLIHQEYIISCQTTITEDMIIDVPSQSYDINSMINLTPLKDTNIDNIISYNVIIDIGTTTLAFYLINLRDGSMIDSYSCLNPQRKYGDDVINRIMQCKTHLLEVQGVLIQVIQQVLSNFKKDYSIETIDSLFVSGNTTMLHIFLGVNPISLGFYPYKPVFLNFQETQGSDLNLDCKKILVLPSISSFIGSDITMGIIASGMLQQKNALLIDLGTNGEMILKKENDFYGASTAAGPAFEGTNIECGSGAINGAINKIVYHNKQFNPSYLGDHPKTLTGSAVIDLVSILLDEKLIEKDGYLNTHDPRFNCHDNKVFIQAGIYLSQNDIRQLQLAKSAIRSGIDTLLKTANLTYDQLDMIYLAGGFGFYFNPINAVKIGLIPHAFLNKIEVIGNSSASGAIACALNHSKINEALLFSQKVYVIDLNTNILFNDLFIQNISF